MFPSINQSKDDIHKHKKEKVIDQYLISSEIKRAKEIRHKVKQMEKVVEVKLGHKRKRIEEESGSIKNDEKETEEIKNEKEDSSQNDSGIDTQFAVEKILKHLEKPAALQKCINLLQTLLIKMDKLSSKPFVLVKIIYKILQLPFKFNDNSTTNQIKGFFDYVEKEIERIKLEIGNDRKTNNNDYNFLIDIFEIFKISFKEQIDLMTDDSFKFSLTMKNLDKYYENLAIFDISECDEISKFEKAFGITPQHQKDSDLEFNIYRDDTPVSNILKEKYLIHTNVLLQGIKRNILFDCLRQAFTQYKNKWAYPSINSLFTKLYMDKQKLSEKQFEQLDSMISIIKNKSSVINIMDQNRLFRDENIKSTPLEASHKVTDARSEKLVDASSNTWQAKQMGLTSGKMYINN